MSSPPTVVTMPRRRRRSSKGSTSLSTKGRLPTAAAGMAAWAWIMAAPAHRETKRRTLEQKVALRHRQALRRLAGEQFTVGPHLIGFGIDVDVGRGAVVDHRLLGD